MRTAIIDDRVEDILLFLNLNGPTIMADIAGAMDLTRGQCDYTVRRNSEFVRAGQNGEMWAASRVSQWWTDEAAQEFGEPLVGGAVREREYSI